MIVRVKFRVWFRLERWQIVFMGQLSSTSPRFAIWPWFSQRENFYKNISEFCTYYVTYDFQHCSDICLMSAEIDVFEIDAEVS